jgi:hypothetical protein
LGASFFKARSGADRAAARISQPLETIFLLPSFNRALLFYANEAGRRQKLILAAAAE